MRQLKYVLIGLMLLLTYRVDAQVPFAFNYQGVAKTIDGAPISDQDISLLISIVSGSEDGFIEFIEQHAVHTSPNGLFSLRIGEGEYIDGNLRNIEWGLDVYFIKTEIDVEGGDNFVALGSSKLYSVPYALYAMEAASTTIDNQSSSDDQELTIDGLTLSIENGNSVDLSGVRDGVTDADSDPTNEVQSLIFSGTSLSLSGANSVDLSTLGSGGTDGDADPTNELQALGLSGTILSLSEGNSVDLASIGGGGSDADGDPTNELQVLGFSGTVLTLSGGNSVDLSSLRSGGADADSDPTNELQTLTLLGNQLSLSGGNSVILPSSGNGGSSPWIDIAPQIIHYTGIEASLGPDQENPSVYLTTDDESSGVVDLHNESESSAISSVTAHAGFGFYSFADDNKISTWLGIDEETGEGFLNLYNDGDVKINADISDSEVGRVRSFGSNESLNWSVSSLANEPNFGFLSMRDDDGDTRAAIYVAGNGSGRAFTEGPNGNANLSLTNLSGNNNHGYFSVHDALGDDEAGIYVNSSGQGVVYADLKNFRTQHPALEDHEIVYASLEGPEAGAYLRGTGQLNGGHGNIDFPDHFMHIIAEQGMTIMITPLSAKSKGIAVVTKGKAGFEVQELLEGTGDYSFDWEVKGVRAGYESYEPIRKKDRSKRNVSKDEREEQRSQLKGHVPPNSVKK